MKCEVKNVSVKINGKQIIHDVSSVIKSGECVGIIGANGAGKTTLLRSMAGLQDVSNGKILYNEKPITHWNKKDFAKITGYLAQDSECHWDITAIQAVTLGRLPHRKTFSSISNEDKSAIADAMKRTQTTELANRNVTTLSGGESARVLLARAIAGKPSVLLADEPTASLDPAQQIRLMHLLRSLSKDGTTIITVLHDLTLAARFCNRLILMSNGRIIANDEPEKVLTNQTLKTTFNIEAIFGNHKNEMYVIPWELM